VIHAAQHVCAAVLLSLAIAPAGLAASAEAMRPNIVLLMSDDQGWGDAGFMGHPHLKTPHLDEMAEDGMAFYRFYAAAPADVPTRTSILTGLHPARWSIENQYYRTLPKQVKTVAEVLQDAGYRTGHFGKWQLGAVDPENREPNWGRHQYTQEYSPPSRHGFDVYFSTRSSLPTYNPYEVPAGWDIDGLEAGDPFPGAFWNEDEQRVEDNISGDGSDAIMDRVVPFVQEAAETGTPFFAAVWFHAPHTPVVASPYYRDFYKHLDEAGQHYYGCITALDYQIGRLRETLEEADAAENTLILFCSDNGPRGKRDKPTNGSTGSLKGRKAMCYEGGIRVPAVAVWPRTIEPGSAASAPVSTLDFMPTVVDLLGLPPDPERPMDGVSFEPLLRGEDWLRPAPLFYAYEDYRVLLDTTHKLLSFDEGRRWRLYELATDPGEVHSIADEQPERFEQMRALYDRWWEAVVNPQRGLPEEDEDEADEESPGS